MMSDLTHKEYQKLVAKELTGLSTLPVQLEWRSMQQQRSLYCPTVDIAVGPFVYDGTCIPSEHDSLARQWQKQIQAMLDYYEQNVEKLSWENCSTSVDDVCYKNKTARCFIAIEVEDTGGRKQLIGTALNAMALGHLAIVVTSSPGKLKAFIKLRRYLWFLSKATNLNTDNLLILTREQLVDSIELGL